MKKILLFSAILFFTGSEMMAQVTWPTFFVTSPSTGCDGVWAINASSTGGACGMTPYTYTFTPSGCATTAGLYFSGDTLFVPLCAVPCSMALDNASGQTCLASTGTATGMNGAASSATKIYPSRLRSGGEITIEFPASGERLIQLFDAAGRMVRSVSAEQQQFRLGTSALSKGIYYLSITSSAIGSELNKIIIE